MVDLVFSTAEEIIGSEEPEENTEKEERRPKFIPVAFHQDCIDRVEQALNVPLVKKTRSSYSSGDGTTTIICTVSKEHSQADQKWYWFAFHPHQKEFLQTGKDARVAFGCGSAEAVLLVPFSEFDKWLDGLNVTEKEDRRYWHVSIARDSDKYALHQKGGAKPVDLSKYLL